MMKYGQAPWFSGSSWAHISSAFGYVSTTVLSSQRQRVVLLEAHEGDLGVRVLLELGDEVVVDLAGEEHARAYRGLVGDAGVVETGSNLPCVKSSTWLVAPRRRSMAFGVKTTSGRRGRA